MIKVAVIKNFIIIAVHKTIVTSKEIVNNLVTHNSSIIVRYLFPVLLIAISSCKNSGKTGYTETPTRGDIHIVSDDSFQPLIDTEIFTFTHLYPYARITPFYKPEYDVITDFMNDSGEKGGVGILPSHAACDDARQRGDAGGVFP